MIVDKDSEKAPERYVTLDGLRAYAIIGIVLMHVRVNGHFAISGVLYDSVINSFTNFTYLFMLLSAFSMSCGYYERFRDGTIHLDSFYKRRYQRIWPFFALMCTFDLILEHSLNAVFEWAADLTLAFGLIPNHNIEVIGVGWFLGTVFSFYMLFPFFTFLIGNKRRAWFSFGVAVLLHLLCLVRFTDTSRKDIIFSSIFFLAGGLIYLYRDEFRNMSRWMTVTIVLCFISSVVVYYHFRQPGSLLSLPVFTLLCFLLISLEKSGGRLTRGLLCNCVILYLSKISMEIYLCHMVAFRVLEKMHLLHIFGNETVNYLFSAAATVLGAVFIALVYNEGLVMLKKLQKKQV
ncbi:MAG: acyltransferase [Oscillospiraceae bacterium]|nr:acyltransferase [Oscillospiraceae bacterium]